MLFQPVQLAAFEVCPSVTPVERTFEEHAMTGQAAVVKTRDVTESRNEPPEHSHRERRRFYIGAGVFSILLAFAGFGPSLIDHSRRFAPPEALYVAHGTAALAWLALFLAQATLVARGRVALHRRLGWAGPVIAAAVIVMSVAIVIDGAFRQSDLSGDVARLLAPAQPPLTEAESIAGIWGPLGVLMSFAILVAAGLLFRHRPEVHKRLMVFALVPLGIESLLHLSGNLVGRVPASQGLLQAFWLGGSLLLVTVLPIYDKVSRGRIHPASVWIPVLFVAWTVFSNAVVFRSAPAFRLASWILQR
jgi:hypothetical protein